MTTTRYIVITVPPPPVAEAIQALRRPLCERYGAGWALQYPPHLTLRTGLVVPQDREDEVTAAFAGLAAQQAPFVIRTGPPACGRMAYEGDEHCFLYLPVVPDPPLVALNRTLLSCRQYRKSDKTAFQPHVTLLWGDLRPEEEIDLRTAVDAGRPPLHEGVSWRCEDVCLYIRHGNAWRQEHAFPLGG